MKKFMTDYLTKKVQKLQQALLDKRTVYLMVFTNPNYEEGLRTNISFDIKNDEEEFESYYFYDWQTEATAKATYEQICARLRELGHKV